MSGNMGVVLAGGKSSRMGKSKAELPFLGEPLLRRVVGRLSAAVDDVVVIGPLSLQALVPDVTVISDVISPMGPLGGLYTALTTAPGERLFLVACDMPLLQPGLVRAMLAVAEASEASDAVTLVSRGRMEPLHTVYARSCLPAVEEALAAEQRALHHVLERLSVVMVSQELLAREDPNKVSALNVNTPEEWGHALQLAAALEPPPNASTGVSGGR
jgi:molybdopterin-guanine dinucleotide biosynthesis protein A